MKNLNFISTNSSLQFITIYLYYIYVIVCFLGFFWSFLDIRLGIKSLFRQKPFLKRSKKVQCVSFVRRVLTSTVLFFIFLLKNSSNSCSFVAYSDVLQNKQIKHLRRRPVGQGSLLVNLIPTFPIIFPSHTLFDK